MMDIEAGKFYRHRLDIGKPAKLCALEPCLPIPDRWWMWNFQDVDRQVHVVADLVPWVEPKRKVGEKGMSKASEYASLVQQSREHVPDAFRFLNENGENALGASVNSEGYLELEETYLAPEDALKLRDWLTATFDEPNPIIPHTGDCP